MCLDLRGSIGFFCRGVLYSILLSSMMLFKRSFGFTRSLFTLYVHEHDRLGFGMLTVETAVIRERKCKYYVLFNQARKYSNQSHGVVYDE